MYGFVAEFKQQLVDQEKQSTLELKRLQTELDECQSQLTVLTLELQSKLESETRKYREELSSLQHLLNGNKIKFVPIFHLLRSLLVCRTGP